MRCSCADGSEGPLFALAFGFDHLDDLSPASDEISQQPGRLVGQGADFGPGRLGEAGDNRSIDRIGLGALSQRLGEGSDLRRIDDHDGKTGRRQSRCTMVSKPPVASSTTAAPSVAEPRRQPLESRRVAFRHKDLPARRTTPTSSRSLDTSMSTLPGPSDPSLRNRARRRPRRLLGFDGTTDEAPTSPRSCCP